MKNKPITLDEYMETHWDETKVSLQIDEEVPNWLDSDWQDDGDGYEEGQEWDWYQEYCNGEAEDVVRYSIARDIKNTFKDHKFDDMELDQYIREKYPSLDVA